jgi:hypothetical protein
VAHLVTPFLLYITERRGIYETRNTAQHFAAHGC